ncbi:hypothetical protein NLU13_6701 [Sarocladium strictum]|uniref:Uncharacterized protein n=1 Tax=Sarocladium strictum TaxID=5046 RepID=A0AA39GE61_SARSR|nr:hypothetical protein NLU13_6701 [Sarocladium strictum]
MRFLSAIAALLTAASPVSSQSDPPQQFNQWCGKYYEQGAPNVIPAGRLEEPPQSQVPLLDLRVSPRHSIYVGSESRAELIIDAAISSIHGEPFHPCQGPKCKGPGGNKTGKLTVVVETEGVQLVNAVVDIDTSDNLLPFDSSALEPRSKPYVLTLTATIKDPAQNKNKHTATAELFYLPDKQDGSVVKIDYLYGALLVRKKNTSGKFKPFFSYGFYNNYSGYLNDSVENIEAYIDSGYTAAHPVPGGDLDPMTWLFGNMDRLGLMSQFDMRHTWKNQSALEWQVEHVRDEPALLTWYTGDEADGWQEPFEAVANAYDQIVALDRYHPVASALNCQNYFFQEYTTGVDIVMTDPYPVSINATWSVRWDTPVNDTFGNCGCDNCRGSLMDVADRMDDMLTYRRWVGGVHARKPIWAVPQNFGAETYWSREPTGPETMVMDVLMFNHGAKGRMAWIHPVSDAMAAATATVAQAVTVSPVVDFFTGANAVKILSGNDGGVDVAYWQLGGRLLIGLANPHEQDLGQVKIELPSQFSVSQIAATPLGNITWALEGGKTKKRKLVAEVVKGLATAYVVLE